MIDDDGLVTIAESPEDAAWRDSLPVLVERCRKARTPRVLQALLKSVPERYWQETHFALTEAAITAPAVDPLTDARWLDVLDQEDTHRNQPEWP